MKRRWPVWLGALAVLAVAVIWGGAWWTAKQSETADDMARFETVDVYVTTFTTELLADAAYGALDDALGSGRATVARRSDVVARFDEVVLRSAYDNEPYVSLNIRPGGKIGAVLFANGDGRLIVTDRMLDLCGQDPDMLRGIFAHELSHRRLQHTKTRLIAAAPTGARLAMLQERPEAAAEGYRRHPEALLGVRFPGPVEQAARDDADARLSELGFATGGFERCLGILAQNREVPGVERFLKAHVPEAAEGEGTAKPTP